MNEVEMKMNGKKEPIAKAPDKKKDILPVAVALLVVLLLYVIVIGPLLQGGSPPHVSATTTLAASQQHEKPLNPDYIGVTAVLQTDKGTIKIALFNDMPITVNNFVGLVRTGFYTNLTFHRVNPSFAIQTGDPTGTGLGGSEQQIPLEVNLRYNNTLGRVGMARAYDINSATSQFYILLSDSPHLDGRYAVFGEVVEGMDVVKNIEKDDMLYNVTLE